MNNIIRDEDVTIELLKKELERISTAIKKSNQFNLTDINVISEEIFCQILNKLFGYNLRAMSAEKLGNFVAVDLIDYDKRVAYQITSNDSREKMIGTMDRFNDEGKEKRNEKKLYEDIDKIYVLALTNKVPNYYEPTEFTLKNGNSFSLKRDVYDFKWLIDKISEASRENPDIIRDMYTMINMVFDSGRLEYDSVVQKSNDYQKKIHVDGEVIGERWGNGEMRMTAYIPKTLKDKICCSIDFRKHNIKGITIVLNQDELLKDFFGSEDEFVEKHCTPQLNDKDEVFIELGNVQMIINSNTCYHLYKQFEELQEKYIKAIKKMEDIYGANGLEKVDEGYKIATLSRSQYKAFCTFIEKHNADYSQKIDENSIFSNMYIDYLYLKPNIIEQNSADIYAKLRIINQKNAGQIDIIWEPGNNYNCQELEGFDNIIKWTANYTKERIEKIIELM